MRYVLILNVAASVTVIATMLRTGKGYDFAARRTTKSESPRTFWAVAGCYAFVAASFSYYIWAYWPR